MTTPHTDELTSDGDQTVDGFSPDIDYKLWVYIERRQEDDYVDINEEDPIPVGVYATEQEAFNAAYALYDAYREGRQP